MKKTFTSTVFIIASTFILYILLETLITLGLLTIFDDRIAYVGLYSKLGIIVVSLFLIRQYKSLFRFHFELNRNSLLAVVLAPLLFIASHLTYDLSFGYFEYPIPLILKSVLLASVFEELFFRGWVYGFLRSKKSSIIGSILISSILFASIHWNLDINAINWLKIGHSFIFGSLLAFIYEKTKNLFYPIIIHIAYNCCNLFISIDRSVVSYQVDESWFLFVVVLLSSIALIVATTAYMTRKSTK